LSSIGALYRVGAVLGLGMQRRLAGALALALAAGCGGARRAARARPTEVLVEVLPRGADVTLDGVPLGPGSRAVAAPPGDEHVLAVVAAGYEPSRRPLAERDLAGARVAEALRPVGFAAAGALDYDDAEGLALAAAFLAAEGDPRDAADYAERAVALEPGLPLAHRARGDALARLGDAARAADAWAEYLRLAPDAPDAGAVAERLEAAREDAARPEGR
jgi:tetratricopeptide (TPR) repeat protein